MEEPPKVEMQAWHEPKGGVVQAVGRQWLFHLSRIPTLLESSTSTFFGSTTSVLGPRILSSPDLDETLDSASDGCVKAKF